MKRTYQERPATAEAVQWTGENADEVQELCGKRATVTSTSQMFLFGERDQKTVTLRLRTDDGRVTVPIGHYVVKLPTGGFTHVPQREFETRFVPVGGDTTLEEGISTNTGKLRAWLSELKDLRERHKYALADIENLKKRFDRERSEFVHQANRDILEDVLKVYDELCLALESGGTDKPLRDGVALIKAHIERILDDEGCQKVRCEVGDTFDHNFHEALCTVDSTNALSGTVTQVYSTGWTLNGRLLRPAKVSVAK